MEGGQEDGEGTGIPFQTVVLPFLDLVLDPLLRNGV